MLTKIFKFNALLLKQGWMSPAYVKVDHKGIIQGISKTLDE